MVKKKFAVSCCLVVSSQTWFLFSSLFLFFFVLVWPPSNSAFPPSMYQNGRRLGFHFNRSFNFFFNHKIIASIKKLTYNRRTRTSPFPGGSAGAQQNDDDRRRWTNNTSNNHDVFPYSCGYRGGCYGWGWYWYSKYRYWGDRGNEVDNDNKHTSECSTQGIRL